MQSIHSSGTFAAAIAKSTPQAQQLAQALRELIGQVYPEATEVPWPKQQVTGYGIGPKKQTEHFCYIGAHAEHVNLGFNHGIELNGFQDLLEGTGKTFRHVKIQTLADVSQPRLRELLQLAVQERQQALST